MIDAATLEALLSLGRVAIDTEAPANATLYRRRGEPPISRYGADVNEAMRKALAATREGQR